MSDSHDHGIQVPRGALIGAGVLIGLTLATVAAVRMTGTEPSARVPAPEAPVASRILRFEDRPNGDVAVLEPTGSGTTRVVQILQSGADGFIRGVLRSMARTRRAAGIGPEHPFVLSLEADGRLVLEDPQTGQRIDLKAFGPTNVASFRRLLDDGETRT